MTPEAEARFERIEASLAETAASLAETTAIAKSNARAIEAVANQQTQSRELAAQIYAKSQEQLIELIRTVGQIAESSDRRLTALENKP